MERTLYVERLYSLGDYKNIKFSNALTGIPEELATNDKVIGLLFIQQFLSVEIAYRKYYQLVERLTTQELTEVIKQLEAERTQTMNELYQEIRASKNPAIVPQVKLTPGHQGYSEEDFKETLEKETE